MGGEWLLPICPSPHTKAQNTYPLTTRSVTLGLFRNSIWKSNKVFFNTPQKDSSLHSSLIMLCLSEMPPDPAVSLDFWQRQFQGNLSSALVLAHSTTPQALSHLDYPPRPLCWVQSSAWPVPPHPETTIWMSLPPRIPWLGAKVSLSALLTHTFTCHSNRWFYCLCRLACLSSPLTWQFLEDRDSFSVT